MTSPLAGPCRRVFLAALLLFPLAVAGAASAAPVQWPVSEGGNGHHYERVYTGTTPTWEDARAAAAAMSHQGVPGHLVTITSEAERQFLVAHEVFGPGDPGTPTWIGAVQQPGAASAADGWTWVTGEPWGFTA